MTRLARGGLCPACLLRLAVQPPTPSPGSVEDSSSRAEVTLPDSSDSAERIGRYNLLERIGEGGFGAVWMAEQQEPVRRKVALKIIKLGMDTRQVVARFEAERQALALMDHPHIARVFDGGATETGRPFFVMELVEGLPITEFCNTRRLTVRQRVELFILVCQGVQHAHQKGVIHRDLKPTNILVAEREGQAVPKIIDFGVAKAIEEPLTESTVFTRFHQCLGTPAYMSPEQAGLGGLDIDTRADIYALGALLYELLTGFPPLPVGQRREESWEAMLRTIRETEPVRPSARLAQRQRTALPVVKIDPDLDWIVLKALEKDRQRRYESASGFAADLRRFLDNEPILARPPSTLYRAMKLVRRNKASFAAAGAISLVVLAGLVVSWRQTLEVKRHLAQAKLNAYVSDINVAQQVIAENNLERARELLVNQIPRPGDKQDLRGFEWHYLWQQTQSDFLPGFEGEGGQATAFSEDGRWLAHGGGRKVVIRGATSHQITTTLETPGESLSFSSDGQLLATAGSANVSVWETATWHEAAHLSGASSIVLFSPDASWLITGETNGNKLVLWERSHWTRVAECVISPDIRHHLPNGLAISPDGKTLATMWVDFINDQAGLRFWKLPSLEPAGTLFPTGMPMACAAFVPDGTRLVTGGWDGRLLVWDMSGPNPRLIHEAREHSSHITRVAIAAKGDVMATSGEDQALNLWDLASYRHLVRLRGHTNQIGALSISPNGSVIASGSRIDSVARLWNADRRNASDLLDVGSLIAGFTADSQNLVVGPRQGQGQWHLCGPAPLTFPAATNLVLPSDLRSKPFDVFGDKPLGVLGHARGFIELWDLAAGARLASWRAETSDINQARFSPDGAQVATGSATGRVALWDSITHTELAAVQPDAHPVSALAYSPNGRTLAMATESSPVFIWDIQNRRQPPQRLVGSPEGVCWIAFSRDGGQVAVADLDGRVKLFSLSEGGPVATLKGHVMGVLRAEFFPDGKTLVTGSLDGKIKLWNLATHQELMTLTVPLGGTFHSLSVSPDGRTLAVGYMTWPGHHVRLFHAPSFPRRVPAEETHKSSKL